MTAGSEMNEDDRLIEKLRKIEALYAEPGREGERRAAGAAIEYRFSMIDPWSRSLFGALLRQTL